MTLTASQDDWLRVRSYLREHRYALAVDAAGDYPAGSRVDGTPLLAAPEWRPAEPVPLHDIELEFIPRPRPAATGGGPGPGAGLGSALAESVAPLLPERLDGTRYQSYSDALRGPRRPGGVREPPHLPADRGRSR